MDLLTPRQVLLHGNQQSADLPLKGLYAGRHQLKAGVGGKGISSEPNDKMTAHLHNYKHFAKEKLPSTCTADCSQHDDDDNANYDYSKETVCTVCGISFSGQLLCPKGALALARVHSKVD